MAADVAQQRRSNYKCQGCLRVGFVPQPATNPMTSGSQQDNPLPTAETNGSGQIGLKYRRSGQSKSTKCYRRLLLGGDLYFLSDLRRICVKLTRSEQKKSNRCRICAKLMRSEQKKSNSRRICAKLMRSEQKIRHKYEQNSQDLIKTQHIFTGSKPQLSKTHYIVAGSGRKRRDLTKSDGDFMDLVESSSDLKILAVNVMYLGRFGFFQVLGRRSETKLTRSDSRKKDPPPTAGVVRSAGDQSSSG